MDSKKFTTIKKAGELLFLFTKISDLLIFQTKSKPQEALKFKLTKTLETFSFITPLELEENKRLLGLTNLEKDNSISNIVGKF